MAEESAQLDVPPHIRLIQLAAAVWPSRIVYVAAKIGLADHMACWPKSIAQLADKMSVSEATLRNLTIGLTALGILIRDGDGQFALTSMGNSLKTGAPGSARAIVLLMHRDRLRAKNVVDASRATQPTESQTELTAGRAAKPLDDETGVQRALKMMCSYKPPGPTNALKTSKAERTRDSLTGSVGVRKRREEIDGELTPVD